MILKKEMQRYLVSAMFAIAVLAFPGVAHADPVDEDQQQYGDIDMDYEGEIDRFTGEPVEEDQTDAPITYQDVVAISEKAVYSKISGLYEYTTDKGTIYSNVASGMVVTNAVTIRFSEGLSVTIYKDGTAIGESSEYVLEEPGQYSVTTMGNEVELATMNFTIVGQTTNMVYRYDMPDKFYITSVTYNDKEKEFTRSAVATVEDGHYVINYGCPSVEKEYTLDIYVDHTDPVIEIAGVDKKNVARGPVEVKSPAEKERMTITLDGKVIKLEDPIKLEKSGNYVITLADEAGNVVTENVRILTYINFKSAVFIVVFLLFAAGLGLYLWLHKKTFKVR